MLMALNAVVYRKFSRKTLLPLLPREISLHGAAPQFFPKTGGEFYTK